MTGMKPPDNRLLDATGAPVQRGPTDVVKEVLAAEPPLDFIFHPKSYFNQNGMRIEENILAHGEFPPGFPKFVAHATAIVKMPDPKEPGGFKKHKEPLTVPLKATTIVEAFAEAPELLQNAAEQYQKHFEENIKGLLAKAGIRKELTKGLAR